MIFQELGFAALMSQVMSNFLQLGFYYSRPINPMVKMNVTVTGIPSRAVDCPYQSNKFSGSCGLNDDYYCNLTCVEKEGKVWGKCQTGNVCMCYYKC